MKAKLTDAMVQGVSVECAFSECGRAMKFEIVSEKAIPKDTLSTIAAASVLLSLIDGEKIDLAQVLSIVERGIKGLALKKVD